MLLLLVNEVSTQAKIFFSFCVNIKKLMIYNTIYILFITMAKNKITTIFFFKWSVFGAYDYFKNLNVKQESERRPQYNKNRKAF